MASFRVSLPRPLLRCRRRYPPPPRMSRVSWASREKGDVLHGIGGFDLDAVAAVVLLRSQRMFDVGGSVIAVVLGAFDTL